MLPGVNYCCLLSGVVVHCLSFVVVCRPLLLLAFVTVVDCCVLFDDSRWRCLSRVVRGSSSLFVVVGRLLSGVVDVVVGVVGALSLFIGVGWCLLVVCCLLLVVVV